MDSNINVVCGLIALVGVFAFLLGHVGSKYPSRGLTLFCAFTAWAIVIGIPALWVVASYFPGEW